MLNEKKLMHLRIDHQNLLEKYRIIWTKIEDLKYIELNALPVYDNRYIKSKIETYSDKVYTNIHSLNEQKDHSYVQTTSMKDIIFWEFLILYQSFFSPQVKRSVNISNKHGIYDMPHHLPNELRLRILRN